MCLHSIVPMKQSLLTTLAAFLIFTTASHAQLRADGATASFQGKLPPKPVADLTAEQQSTLERELADATAAFQAVKKHAHAADADIFLKAVRYALEFHEWYDKKPEDGFKKAHEELAEATRRIEALKQNKMPWLDGPGQKVLGFYSQIDDSPQPYGVEIPEGLKWGNGNKAIPMWIWLHGRGDTATDIHFIASRMKAKRGQFQPTNAILVHPFGRFCNGWKNAGETDVFECKADASKRFNIDQNRVVLAGFSMGGAGAWHLGAHFADQWCCVHTGAGFVDVKRYQKLTPEKFPPWYEQKLWGVYDVPDYARNFLNVPLISYSGEIDAQRDSAEYMMEVLGKEGLHPPYLIGPGMPHKYHPDTLKELQSMIEKEVEKGRNPAPEKVVLQFQAAAYAKIFWLRCLQVKAQWEDTRLEADMSRPGELNIATKNVLAFQLDPNLASLRGRKVTIDGETPSSDQSNRLRIFMFQDGHWKEGWVPNIIPKAGGVAIDDAFKSRFIVLLPDKAGRSAKVDEWVKTESAHFIERWRKLMRGDPIVMKSSERPVGQRTRENLIVWGDDQSNKMVDYFFSPVVKWKESELIAANCSFPAANHVPVMIRPNFNGSLAHGPYIVLNSGLTFREAHDKTNSLQNPKLPDWAILDITQPPTAESAGKVVAADFFDEHWQVKPDMPPVDSK